METPNEINLEVINLCNAILEMNTVDVLDLNGCDYSECHFCNHTTKLNGKISDIKHDVNCVYTIAKGLMTNIK